MTMRQWDRLGWVLAGLFFGLLILSQCGCIAAPVNKVDGGESKFSQRQEPAERVFERDILDETVLPDGTRTIHRVGERVTEPATPPMKTFTESSSKSPSATGSAAKDLETGSTEAGPDGAGSGGAKASFWEMKLPVAPPTALYIIGGLSTILGFLLFGRIGFAASAGLVLGGLSIAGSGFVFATYPWVPLVGLLLIVLGLCVGLWMSRHTLLRVIMGVENADPKIARATKASVSQHTDGVAIAEVRRAKDWLKKKGILSKTKKVTEGDVAL